MICSKGLACNDRTKCQCIHLDLPLAPVTNLPAAPKAKVCKFGAKCLKINQGCTYTHPAAVVIPNVTPQPIPKPHIDKVKKQEKTIFEKALVIHAIRTRVG